jgi:hypothetical protein
MDKKQAPLHAAKEMEEAEEISAGDDPLWIPPRRSSEGMDKDEQVAIRRTQRGSLCNEPRMVQSKWLNISQRLHEETL